MRDGGTEPITNSQIGFYMFDHPVGLIIAAVLIASLFVIPWRTPRDEDDR